MCVPSQVRHIFGQICCGVAFCHSLGVAHRDLKPENVLIHRTPGDPPETYRIKVADFGLSTLMQVPSHLLFIYIYICIYVYIYINTYTYIYIYIYVCMYICMYVCMYACRYVCMLLTCHPVHLSLALSPSPSSKNRTEY